MFTHFTHYRVKCFTRGYSQWGFTQMLPRVLPATNRTFSLIIKAENLQNYFEDFPPSTKRLSSWFCDLWYVILWSRFSQITKSHITNHKITITKSQITITKFVIVILWDLWFCDFVFTRIPNLFSCICPLFILWFRSQNLWLWLCDFVIRDLWFYDILDHKITNHESQKIVIINLWFCDFIAERTFFTSVRF